MHYDHTVATNSLYIHWPFCPYKCHFCPFVALASHDNFMQEYHETLVQEITDFGKKLTKKMPIQTVFLGGGTPSTYPEPLLLDMFGTLRTWFEFCDDAEVTIEVNPGTVTPAKLAAWKKAGITRLSIGVQSLKDDVLVKLNRLQSNHDVYEVLASARPYFENISIDLIVGLPGVSIDEWKQMVAEIVTWPIVHVSVYFLSVHENTPLYFGVKAKKISLPCDDEVVDLYCWTAQTLKESGFFQYEVSNFAKSGYESQHNKAYWERKPYKGFGLGACSFDGERRFQNQKNLGVYLRDVKEHKDCTIFEETLTREQVYLEKIMLGMRRSTGVAIADLVDGLTVQEKDRLFEQIRWLEQHNFIVNDGDRIILTPAGLAIENEIVVKLSL